MKFHLVPRQGRLAAGSTYSYKFREGPAYFAYVLNSPAWYLGKIPKKHCAGCRLITSRATWMPRCCCRQSSSPYYWHASPSLRNVSVCCIHLPGHDSSYACRIFVTSRRNLTTMCACRRRWKPAGESGRWSPAAAAAGRRRGEDRWRRKASYSAVLQT